MSQLSSVHSSVMVRGEHRWNMRRRLTRSAAATTFAASLALGATGCLASTQQEVQLGADYAQQINQQLPLIRDPEVTRYINVLGDSIARVSDDRDLNWTFQVVDQPDVNAFAVPGGHIYVYRGLIEKVANMSELAGVMGHEIAHVTRRHSMKQMAKGERANVLVAAGCIAAPAVCQSGAGSAAIQVGGGALFAKFSRDDETEADRYGVQYVTRAGIDPRGMPSMFRTLLSLRQSNPSAVEGWFSSHPVEEARIRVTEGEIAKINPTVLRSLTKDSQAFRSFKSRLASLPRTARRAAQ
jgi:beta-barrel assembly-enhancing protease